MNESSMTSALTVLPDVYADSIGAAKPGMLRPLAGIGCCTGQSRDGSLRVIVLPVTVAVAEKPLDAVGTMKRMYSTGSSGVPTS